MIVLEGKFVLKNHNKATTINKVQIATTRKTYKHYTEC